MRCPGSTTDAAEQLVARHHTAHWTFVCAMADNRRGRRAPLETCRTGRRSRRRGRRPPAATTWGRSSRVSNPVAGALNRPGSNAWRGDRDRRRRNVGLVDTAGGFLIPAAWMAILLSGDVQRIDPGRWREVVQASEGWQGACDLEGAEARGARSPGGVRAIFANAGPAGTVPSYRDRFDSVQSRVRSAADWVTQRWARLAVRLSSERRRSSAAPAATHRIRLH